MDVSRAPKQNANITFNHSYHPGSAGGCVNSSLLIAHAEKIKDHGTGEGHLKQQSRKPLAYPKIVGDLPGIALPRSKCQDYAPMFDAVKQWLTDNGIWVQRAFVIAQGVFFLLVGSPD